MKAKRRLFLVSTVFVLAIFLAGCQPTRVVVVPPPPPPGPPPTAPGLQRAAINHIRNAKMQLARGHCRQAIQQLNMAIEKDPSNPDGYYWMGAANYSCGYYPWAMDQWRTVLRFTGGNPIWESRVRTAIGLSLEAQGRWAEAHQEYDLAFRLDPGNPIARMGYDDARLYAEAPPPAARRGRPRGAPPSVPHHQEKLEFIMQSIED